jgi:hypothetical protein
MMGIGLLDLVRDHRAHLMQPTVFMGWA